jgi:hypothetical protein
VLGRESAARLDSSASSFESHMPVRKESDFAEKIRGNGFKVDFSSDTVEDAVQN